MSNAIVLREDGRVTNSVILTEFGCIISYRDRDAELEYEYAQVGLRNENLDTMILALQAVRELKRRKMDLGHGLYHYGGIVYTRHDNPNHKGYIYKPVVMWDGRPAEHAGEQTFTFNEPEKLQYEEA